MSVRSAQIPTSTHSCPFCDAFPFDTASEMGEHVATVHVPTGDLTVRTSAPVPTGSGRFETVPNGFGGSTTRRRVETPARGDLATEKQVAYALSLAESRLALDPQGRDDDGKSIVEVLGPALSGSDDRSEWLPALREHFESMTRRSISSSIDAFRSAPTVSSTRQTASTTSTSSPSQTLSAGMYRVGETIYKVQAARTSGNLYAKRLDGNAETGFTFEYEQGAIRSVRESGVRLTVEEAQAFGRRTGTCCVCAAVLTNPESIALGIGPICGGRI